MQYSQYAKNHGRDLILYNRLMIMRKINFNWNKTAKRYAYYMAAYLGIIL